jgi:hypothetical protein
MIAAERNHASEKIGCHCEERSDEAISGKHFT